MTTYKFAHRYGKALQSLLGLLIVLVYLFPIYWMIVSSLKTSGEIFSNPPTLFPNELYLGNYLNQLRNSNLYLYLKNSFIISVCAMIGGVLLAAPASYALARKPIRGIGVIMFLVIIIQMVPSNSLVLPLYAMFSKAHMTDSYVGVILANITGSLPFVLLLLRTAFLNVPKGLEDAAAIDGCSNWGTFFKVMLPLTLPSLLTCAAFAFIFAWGELLYALVLLPNQTYWPITLGMRTFISQYGTDWGGLMATAAITSAPILLIFIFTQKHIVGGITAGSVKG
ncbi:carbohydrate ABC transporter permease [Harryflintia acetispora]|uniref:carbohydrate ABC transporter permease n=1 Tax=Harryflintia acetispora TaxID=1849041 RepID=UPI001896B005|nr:carbohydrate ABC transporter permease [Harryflintia acetispora]